MAYYVFMKSIFDYWPIPEFEPRPNQIKGLEWLEENWQTKYLLLQAPVGSGKSLVGATFAAWRKGEAGKVPTYDEFGAVDGEESLKAGFYLTPQIILQKQYEDSFPEYMMAGLYGKSNYTCDRVKSTCDVGSALNTGKRRCHTCPYKLARADAVGSDHTVLNYKLALLQFLYTQTWNNRHVLIHDECHGLEEYLTELTAPSISKWRCERFGIKYKGQDTLDAAMDWAIQVYVPGASKYLTSLKDEVADILRRVDSEPTTSEAKKVREKESLQEHLDDLHTILLTDRETIRTTSVLVTDDTMMKFKPLSGAGVFHHVLDHVADNHLFMSSTILNPRGYCADLGIDYSEAAYLELDSDFPVEQRPVYYMPQCKMNASWNTPENTGGRKKMRQAVLDIVDMHKNDSGIIHTGNFKIAQWLTRELLDHGTHNIWQHNPDSGDNRNDVIAAFQKDMSPAILISPSITEGLDLKNDLARFAIFAKIPFGFLGDQWIKQRMKMSQEWYQRRTLISVIQGAGRHVRSDSDWGNTYILDQSWGFLFKKGSDYVPEWWKDGYFVKD